MPDKNAYTTGSQGGTRMKLKGKGLPKRGGKNGDQYAILEVTVPEDVTDEERELFKSLAALPRAKTRPD